MSLVRFRPEAVFADLAHLVERNLAKVEVAGSSPVIRSKKKKRPPKVVFFFLNRQKLGLERAGPEKCPVDSFPARGFSRDVRAPGARFQ